MDDLAKPRVQLNEPTPVKESAVKSEPETIVNQKQAEMDMYLSYSLDHDVPFLADYYGIGNLINYKDLPYKAEVDAIDEFLIDEVKSKRLDNNTEAVKKRLAQLEKVAGIQPYTPTPQRVKTLAAYAKYMSELSKINQPVVF